ncbi:MAG TPA: SUF system Fe-S cluster assembly protein [Dongiaceae bacterium]|jgi:FeS assembly SUF system protein|nr:SUF system Fe-S cluster assembly protein [Dongiaceae bacterium]
MKSADDMNKTDSASASELSLRERVEAVLRTIYDPEIPVNIYELGLIYELDVTDQGVVDIKMTLTAPNCPAAGMMPSEVEAKVCAVDGVTSANVELVWDPPWDKSRMSEAARLELGFV